MTDDKSQVEAAGGSTREPRRHEYLEWMLVVVGIGVGVAGFAHRGHPPDANSVVSEEFTLVPQDAGLLACASNRHYGARRCEFTADGHKGPPTARPIVPAVSLDHKLYFAAGLFQDPNLAAYLRAKTRWPRERFTVICKVRLIEEVDDIGVRFQPNTPFAAGEKGWVADVRSCEIQPAARR
jgi:hypothetical protein